MVPWLLTTLSLAAPARPAAAPSFRNEVEPVLTRMGCNSGACHGALAGKGGFKLSLRGYDPEGDFFTITRQAQSRRVDFRSPDESLLLTKATRKLPHGGGSRFADDSDSHRILRDWVAAGAPGPSPGDATLVKLELAPAQSTRRPGDALQVTATATYSDGRKVDVTPWAKFGSSADAVATVDEDGRVAVAGVGEAGVSALFGSRVAVAFVTVPRAEAVPAGAYAGFRPANVIDAHALAKWKALNLPPSGECTDAEFIRRATLDTCGVLPTPAEVEAFVNCGSPSKRETLVDKLLGRPESVDYWTHKWADLLLVSSRKLQPAAMWAFHRGVKEAVAANEPWDQFARRVLTASGPTSKAGVGSYFALHKDVAELTEATAVTFLGQSINCCRCHNHPLEKWTQDQYWGMANLLSRVGLKAGEGGETVVYTRPEGDALHPRTGLPVPPTPLDGKPLTDEDGDRRAYFADWLTAPSNPYFARAFVNRVWRNYMGRGLVEAEDDLRETNPPTNAALFDALEGEFKKSGYDAKKLMRLILTSATYQRSASPVPGNELDDRYYSRFLVKRLGAEVLLDAYSDITGVPTRFDSVSLGPTAGVSKADLPAGTRAVQLADSQLVSRFLDAFGRAERSQTCSCERSSEASVAQALHLNNGKTLNDKLRDPKSIVSRWVAASAPPEAVVRELFGLALSRPPSASELARFTAALTGVPDSQKREALEDAVWAVLTGREFVFNH